MIGEAILAVDKAVQVIALLGSTVNDPFRPEKEWIRGRI